jgi:hypothetical protein
MSMSSTLSRRAAARRSLVKAGAGKADKPSFGSVVAFYSQQIPGGLAT